MDHEKNVQSCVACIIMMHGSYGEMYESHCPHMDNPLDAKTTMLIWDTGALFGLTTFRSDFIDCVKCKISIRDVTKVNKVNGIGSTLRKFTDIKGLPVYLPCVLYHLPKANVCLSSPQTYHQMHVGYSGVYGDCIKMMLKTSTIDIQTVREKHNLPVVFDSFVSMLVKKALITTMRSVLCHTHLNVLNFFHDKDLGDPGTSAYFWHHNHMHYLHFCAPCVGVPANKNLSGPQKELLKWHWKLGIGMYCIQSLMCERHYEEPDCKTTIVPVIIKPK
jgi:hypothetical protein